MCFVTYSWKIYSFQIIIFIGIVKKMFKFCFENQTQGRNPIYKNFN